MKVAALTLGCKVNQYDTGGILRLFAEKGCEVIPPGPSADIIIVNTCDVTNVSGKKSRQMIRKAAGLNDAAVVAVCGCYTRTVPEAAAMTDGADLIIQSMDYGAIVAAVEEYLKKSGRGFLDGETENGRPGAESNAAFSREAESYAGETAINSGRNRYFLKIEDGCDMFCSYCVIPYARGRVKSRPPEDILLEARDAVTKGYREIVLTGIHIASYGKDLIKKDLTEKDSFEGFSRGLPYIMRKVHGIAGLERLRLGSVEPGAVDADFLEAAALPKVCGHFHLSLQSGCDAVLKAMNRKYTAEEYALAARRLREAKPGACLTTDIIAGFPGETDENFEETCRFAESVGFLKIHAFPFSPKNGTKAASMPGRVPEDVKAARVRRLIGISGKSAAGIYASYMGKTAEVLFEEEADGYVYGHTQNYLRVGVKAREGSGLINRTRAVRVLETGADWARGEVENQ
ncbi:MAG: tRNA (N(6)-L-threonylcarbamoyladenosine(37)-C(2))-methylthiotransferase MtaB [Defluviitaleaceae bacterium]|nr:tRNA (N(6)-L-threonylcarbamoyladenosine(37)-C(2))-methylthiotransferase MtaB [Defluviitaleaceae bacterium]